jgi:parvulin-like peptidyl-prolyl isomerase
VIGALGIALAMAARGEIIDRIAASVGNRVITASDLDRQLRVAAFQDGVKADFSPARKRAAAEAMIEQKLIQTELANSRYPLPDPAELAPAIEQFKKTHFKDDQQYRAALAEYGIAEEDFKELLLWQRTLLLFIQVRFETGVQLGAQDV